MDVNPGAAVTASGGNSGGTFDVDAAAAGLTLTSTTWQPGVRFLGDGYTQVAGGVSLSGAYQLHHLMVTGGLSATDATFDGDVTWVGGTISGQVSVGTAGVLTISGADSKSLGSDSVLDDAGTVVHGDGATLALSQGLNILSGGLYEIANAGSISGPSIISNAGTIRKLGSGTFALTSRRLDNSGSVDVQGGVVRIQRTLSFQPALSQSAGEITISGGATLSTSPGAAAVSLSAGTIDVGDGLLDSQLTLSGTARATIRTAQTLRGLTLSGAASCTLSPGGHAVLVTSRLTISDAGTLDVADNAVVIKNGSPSSVQSFITSGFNGGSWNGAGINSSTAAADALNPNGGMTAIGYASNADYGLTEFAGITGLTSADVLVRFTYYGDADLSGDVTLDDFNQWLPAFQNPSPATNNWLNGDFDYSGTVTLDDFNQWLFTFQNPQGHL